MKLPSPARFLIPLMFLVSGATGLVYEVAWTRQFSVVFGATALAISAVLTSFMAGLAIGSRLVGEWIDRQGEELRTYGALELGIGAAAIVLLPTFDGVQHLFVAIYRGLHPPFWVMSLVRFAFSFALLVAPTALMGGTLPVLVRWSTRSGEHVGRSLGRLYAINTLGALAGCAAAGFWLIEAFGVRQTILLTAGVNIALGLTAVVFGMFRTRSDVPAPAATFDWSTTSDPAAVDDRARRLALIAIGVSGFLALAYEVAWTRVLLFVLSASIHAFTIMLTTFLAGLALGSFALSGRVARLRSGLRLFGWLEIGIGAAALGTVWLLSQYPQLHGAILVLLKVRSWGDLVRVKFIEAGLVVLVPTLLLGMTFPLVSQLYARGSARLGLRIGTILAVNTTGAMLGSFAAGFVLIPLLGTQTTIELLAVGNALLGGILWLSSGPSGARRAALAFAPTVALLGIAFTLPRDAFLPVFGMNVPRSHVTYSREGITGTVTIHETPSSVEGAPPLRVLSINGADVAGTSLMLRTTQKLQAHIPLLLHADPRQVLQVGLGSGETAHSILMHPIERLVGCDISPEVIAAGKHFEDINQDVYEDPRLEIVIDDAKSYIACTERTFDLILNDSVHPMFRGSADLYARDYFETCRSKLRAGGIMSSWFPIGMLSEDDLRMLLHTFQDVFPTSTVWVATNTVTRNALLLGWKDERSPRIDVRRIARMLRANPEIANDLASIGLVSIPALLDAFMLDPPALAAFTVGAKLNSYDRPYLEFSAPRALARGDQALFAINFELLTSHRKAILPYLVNLGSDPEAEARVRERFKLRAKASVPLIRGLQAEIEGRSDVAQAEYRQALEVLPGDPLASRLVQRGGQLRGSIEQRVADGSAVPAEYVEAARWRVEAGDRDAAIAVLRQAIEKHPDALPPHLEIVPLLLDAGDAAGAITEADRALELDARMAPMYALRGQAKWMSGDAAGAEADLARAAAEGARVPWAEVSLGKILRESGREEEAKAHFRNAIEWAPESPAAVEATELRDLHFSDRANSVAEERVQVGFRVAHHAFHREALLHDLAGASTHLAGASAVGGDVDERRGEGFRVAQLHDVAVLALFDHLRHAAHARGHERALHRHRFEERHRERLDGHAGEHGDVEYGEELRHIRAAAGEDHATAKAELLHERFELRPLGAVAHEEKTRFRQLLAHELRRFEERCVVFLRTKHRQDADDWRVLRNAELGEECWVARDRRPLAEVDAVVDDADLLGIEALVIHQERNLPLRHRDHAVHARGQPSLDRLLLRVAIDAARGVLRHDDGADAEHPADEQSHDHCGEAADHHGADVPRLAERREPQREARVAAVGGAQLVRLDPRRRDLVEERAAALLAHHNGAEPRAIHPRHELRELALRPARFQVGDQEEDGEGSGGLPGGGHFPGRIARRGRSAEGAQAMLDLDGILSPRAIGSRGS